MLASMSTHPALAAAVLALAVVVMRVVYAIVSRLVAPYPRARAVVEAIAALMPDVLRAVLYVLRAATGLPLPSPDLDARDAELARLRAALAMSQSDVMALRATRIAPPSPVDPQAGRIRASLLGVVLLVASALLTTRCTASAVETQATAADRFARTLNAVEPRWIAESQRRAIAAARDLCSLDAGPCDRARAHAAADAVLSQWEPVVAAWDSFAAAHDVWRVALEACRARHDAVCSPSVEAATTMLRAVGTWRCAVRAVGHAEYDPLPGEPACTDGGAS